MRREDYSHIRLRAIFVFNNSLSRKNSRLYVLRGGKAVSLGIYVTYVQSTEYRHRRTTSLLGGVCWVRGQRREMESRFDLTTTAAFS